MGTGGTNGSARPLRLMAVAGTRPEAIKLAPLVLAARHMADVDTLLVHTGQHDALFDDGLAAFTLDPAETRALALPTGSPEDLAHAIHLALPPLFGRHSPDMVIVQGDTTSAWAAAQAAHDAGVPLAHVEAGLRSGDPMLPWPEERNRIEIDRVADLLFAPTEQAAANLRREGVPGRIVVTGNSGIDALLHIAARTASPVRSDDVRTILVTCHRRENQGAPIESICAALRLLAHRRDVRLLVVLHPNPAGMAMRAALDGLAGIDLVEPLPYPAMIAALKEASLVLSDSGGLQEECPALGVPLLVLRPNTERPEAIASGNALLIGTDTNAIVAAATRLLDDPVAYEAMTRPAFPFGRGGAAEAMLDAVARFPLPR